MKKSKKIKAITLSICCYIALAATQRDCIWEFHLDVVGAQYSYESQSDDCLAETDPAHCLREVEASFQHNITVAIRDYDECMRG